MTNFMFFLKKQNKICSTVLGFKQSFVDFDTKSFYENLVTLVFAPHLWSFLSAFISKTKGKRKKPVIFFTDLGDFFHFNGFYTVLANLNEICLYLLFILWSYAMFRKKTNLKVSV